MASEASSQALGMLALPKSLQLVVRFLATHVSPADCSVKTLRSVTNANIENGLVEPGRPRRCSDPLCLRTCHLA